MKTMNFTAPADLYALVGDANDMSSQISARLAQLEAMLSAAYGESGQAFRQDLTESVQDNYMWACYTTVSEIRQLFEAMTSGGAK